MAKPYFSTKIAPPNPDDYCSYYEVKKPENIYADVVVNVKNLQGEGLRADDVLSVSILYDGKYTYNSFSTIEEGGGGDFTYTSIETISCLTTRTIHFIAEVPLEVRDSGKSVQVVLSVMGKEYTSSNNEGTGDIVQMSKDLEIPEKTSIVSASPLGLGVAEVIEDYGEITVVSVSFKKKVMPPSPGYFYTYYESRLPDCTYLDVVISFKNLKASSIKASDIANVSVVYANKYEYSAFSTIEEDGDFSYSSITSISPLTSEKLHYLAEVPQAIADSTDPVIMLIEMGGKTFSFQIK